MFLKYNWCPLHYFVNMFKALRIISKLEWLIWKYLLLNRQKCNCKRWLKYQILRVMRQNDANNMIFPPPTSCVISRFLKKDNFLKNILNVLEGKKVFNYIQLISWLAFFIFFCEFQQKIQAISRKCLIWTTDWGVVVLIQLVFYSFLCNCCGVYTWRNV